ncbi:MULTISPECIES: 3D-(3,5/4)-trihydroxycyclohexane-1,2-dione acylhydrolase (decyclizing) [Thermocrispum]|nr:MULTISPECIES: 3D-(3,5/4)-trihydroxycyclohexane-1,2-dione acylhydrolase (decyclizing) [Thermocrispum]
MKLTTSQALVRWLVAQQVELPDNSTGPLFGGVFAIFGHGNVLGLGAALEEYKDQLPVWRGHHEGGMALAAAGFARATQRRQVAVATSSIGPGALNMVTAAGVAHANRLPLLLLPGDTFVGRAPDPVLQQVEHFGEPTVTVNDAFRAVSRYFDRITRPEQLIATLPQVARTLTDPETAGPVTIALPQDVQAEAFDFPESLFEPVVHRIPRPRPDTREVAEAAEVLRRAERPLMILGGGVRYSLAGKQAAEFATKHGIPLAETTAGRTLVPHDHPNHAGPIGITGSSSANTLAAEADVVLAVGTRLQDFTTASWTVFAPEMRMVSINVARFDAVKHGAVAVVGDAAETLTELTAALGDWRAPEAWTGRAAEERAKWDAHVDKLRNPVDGVATYAQVVGEVNEASGPDDYVLTASGGLPGELIGGWRTVPDATEPTMDVEYGFSCMGYELCGAWGAAIARMDRLERGGLVTALVGDGSYLMLNSELYSAAFAGHPFVAVVCDNGGYAVIDRLQRGQGNAAFNNMYSDCRTSHDTPPQTDFAAHAASLGCSVLSVDEPGEFADAYAEARKLAISERRPAVVVLRTHPTTWTESGAWWEVGVPETSSRSAVQAARADFEAAKSRQLRYLAR